MVSHKKLHPQIKSLRSKGLTYSEINKKLGVNIPKSTYSYICKDVEQKPQHLERIDKDAKARLAVYRQKALEAKEQKFKNKLNEYRAKNLDLAKAAKEDSAFQIIALAMLYLGEGYKWESHRGLMLGSSDQKILNIYINLLEICYKIPRSKMRARIQHRADQDSEKLISYWSGATGIARPQFYPCYIDKRTVGKPTKKPNYRGVCVLSCAGTHIQLELEQIVDIIYEALGGRSSVD